MKCYYAAINGSLGAVSDYFKWAGFPNDYFVLCKFILQTIYYSEFFSVNEFLKRLQHRPEALAEIALSLPVYDK